MTNQRDRHMTTPTTRDRGELEPIRVGAEPPYCEVCGERPATVADEHASYCQECWDAADDELPE
jgi:hypothetical protein